MKKKFGVLLIGFMLFPTLVFARSASGSAPSSVTVGENVTFTVYLQGTAAWNVRLSGTGATGGCSSSYADVTADGGNTSKSLSVTCKATSEGTIVFSASGDITSSDGGNSNISLRKEVKVNKPREKEKEARLSSLWVEDYEIDFNRDQYEYELTVEPSVHSLDIHARAMSGYARISGDGEKEIEDDTNTYEIEVTAENGNRKTYKITVYVKDENPIIAKIKEKEYTVIKSRRRLEEPTKFEETTIEIEDYEIPAYENEALKMTVVGLQDEEGTIFYAVYQDGKYTLFNEHTSRELLLYIQEGNLKNYKKTKVKIDEEEYPAYQVNRRFVIVYAMDLETGKKNYYQYDTKEHTFQFYEVVPKKKSVNGFFITTILLSILLVLLLVYMFFFQTKLWNMQNIVSKRKIKQKERKQKKKKKTKKEEM